MKRRSLFIGLAAVGISLLSFSNVAMAHVVVKPAEVLTAGFQTYTIGVPNEKSVATTSLKLVMPAGLKYVLPTNKPGWQIDIEKQGSGEAATVKSITWSGGSIDEGFRDDFTFAAQAPDKVTDLQWKAYQTYADGTVVSWDKSDTGEEAEGENSGPYSVTKVVEKVSAAPSSDHMAMSSEGNADRALAIAVVAALIGLTAVFLATRKK